MTTPPPLINQHFYLFIPNTLSTLAFGNGSVVFETPFPGTKTAIPKKRGDKKDISRNFRYCLVTKILILDGGVF